MRIVIDMQGAQSTGSWNRGIGRYTMSLALALVRHKGAHEVFFALNACLSESIERIRARFDGVLPQENIRVWRAHGSMGHIVPENEWRRKAGELVREAFLASLNPDVVLISSLFEGLVDDAVTSVKRFSRQPITAVILYDLIPYIHRSPYLENPAVKTWYLEKIEHLRHVDLCLAISESSRQEGITELALPSERCVNVSTDADGQFRPISVSAETERCLRERYGLSRDFVMYTGGIDHRKNVEGLIRAYAKLSPKLRRAHQLAIVCSVQADGQERLLALAHDHGLAADELVLTGYVPEEDLIALYNLCAVFVFPSWHEGFGLPALEAMRCGAPVIAANATSLPEVVGFQEALFDPHSDDAISRAIERVLIDKAFRERLVAHGEGQAKRFSWDESAQRVIASMERTVAHLKKPRVLAPEERNKRLKLAYVSPMPPERSGISDYSAELLPALAQHYEIEVVVAQGGISDSWVTQNCPVRTVEWFVENSDRFDRVLYHFGNSAFHEHMFALLKEVPGVVVLHDFYLSGVLHHMDALGYAPGCFTESLYQSHGYVGLLDRKRAKDVADVIWKYPCNREVLDRSGGTIVHSEHSVRLAKHWYGEDRGFSIIPLVRASASTGDAAEARDALGLAEKDFLVCSFGGLGPTKLNLRLLNAWLASDLARSGECRLVFVGENHPGDYGCELISLIKRHPHGKSVSITGWVSQSKYRQYLSAADLGVQLRALSRGEAAASVMDCMNYGLPTIVNANGSMADLDDDAVWKMPDDFDDEDLIEALQTLWRDQGRRQQLGAKAKAVILARHDPGLCAAQYKDAIEDFYSRNPPVMNDLISAIADEPAQSHDLVELAQAINRSLPRLSATKQFLVDVSGLAQRDVRSGIQRVVRSLLHHWLAHPPAGWRIEPVYATPGGHYRYARKFTTAFLGIEDASLSDEPIEVASGDVFFALDYQPQVQQGNAPFYQELRAAGVVVKFMVFDLLCISHSEYCVPGAADGFEKWLKVVGESDGAICTSQSVAEKLRSWMEDRQWQRLRPFKIDSNALGADVVASAPTLGMPTDAEEVMAVLSQRPSFLMVGTLEPRKGHEQALDAIEQLWQGAADVNLVIVGKQGWMVEGLIGRLRSHPELGNRLFWLEGISDEYLEKIYESCTCLIAASYGEGFSLPLIEAAQHKLPIIARDIPIFREVAGEHAYYFNAATADELADSLQAWLDLYQAGKHPRSDDLPRLTWGESAAQLLNIVLVDSGQSGERLAQTRRPTHTQRQRFPENIPELRPIRL
ncbi:MAG: glycosyltransferase [Azoarcus sp.]|nr:glycosyltransferase [Azoarcus sp.]